MVTRCVGIETGNAGVGGACSGVEIASAHPAPVGARWLPHQSSHDGCLFAGASQVLACCSNRGELQL